MPSAAVGAPENVKTGRAGMPAHGGDVCPREGGAGVPENEKTGELPVGRGTLKTGESHAGEGILADDLPWLGSRGANENWPGTLLVRIAI